MENSYPCVQTFIRGFYTSNGFLTLAYPNLLGIKGFVVVVVVELSASSFANRSPHPVPLWLFSYFSNMEIKFAFYRYLS
jgi:hypothetical protein